MKTAASVRGKRRSMSISCDSIVTSRVTSATSNIQIGLFNWPSTTPLPGSVLKTDGLGNLTFEVPNVHTSVDTAAPAYAISTSDDIVAVAGTLDTTLTLPDPSSKVVGDLIVVVKEGGGDNSVTVVPFGTELLSGGSSVVLSQAYGSLKIYTNGTDWFALF
ncbi:EsV-1-124 [Ectocarpus siliculosus]|uniref:EsV-1-124 n=1 Tax=Ectocarpus siliculosus TaxID=2880 RepID=D8LPF0_ECTSI|nr:EsV-1-124 [Ectocarpus siliculosus]|eukprot:CBN80422.1 EsV-1-124 [Ectocarpus siliculosus]